MQHIQLMAANESILMEIGQARGDMSLRQRTAKVKGLHVTRHKLTAEFIIR